jgi:hypothetical protein
VVVDQRTVVATAGNGDRVGGGRRHLPHGGGPTPSGDGRRLPHGSSSEWHVPVVKAGAKRAGGQWLVKGGQWWCWRLVATTAGCWAAAAHCE